MGRSVFTPRFAVSVASVGLSYGALVAVAILMTRLDHGIALLWLANAPLIAVLCRAEPGQRRWYIGAALTGELAALLLTSSALLAAPLFALNGVGEGVLAALLLRRWGVHRSLFDRPRSILVFVLAAGLVAPVISGIIGAWLASHWLPLHFLPTLFDWVMGHGIGNLIGTPLTLLLLFRGISWGRLKAPKAIATAFGNAVLVSATTFLVFDQSFLPLLFLPIVPVLVATFTMRRFGAAFSIIAIALIGGTLTSRGSGPMMLIHDNEAGRLQFFQFYIAVVFLIALPVAAALVQRDRLLRALRESEARYRLLTENASDIMLTLEPDGIIRFVSPAIREMGYLDPEEVVGRNAASLVLAQDRAQVAAVHAQALAEPEHIFRVEYRAIKGNGEVAWFESKMRSVRDETGRVTQVISVIRDLDARKSREDELRRAANTDPLTGLLNRAAFHRAVRDAQTEVSNGQPATLALLDLDHFKRINDSYGHPVGDATLLMLADLLRANLRPQDAIGRVGGEEFGILLAGLNAPEAATVCERVRAALSKCPVPGTSAGTEPPVFVTTSIGLCPLTGSTILDTFRDADAALYVAKANGRNRIEMAA